MILLQKCSCPWAGRSHRVMRPFTRGARMIPCTFCAWLGCADKYSLKSFITDKIRSALENQDFVNRLRKLQVSNTEPECFPCSGRGGNRTDPGVVLSGKERERQTFLPQGQKGMLWVWRGQYCLLLLVKTVQKNCFLWCSWQHRTIR